jgi:hypothetical protein
MVRDAAGKERQSNGFQVEIGTRAHRHRRHAHATKNQNEQQSEKDIFESFEAAIHLPESFLFPQWRFWSAT